ncbi:MAG: ABC transporter permease [Clostridiales Family XIII bacterium]|jgi:hypothetical protein|nr:ABC transporter permease [Clostridiales Family XIII bacterium]
MRNLSAIFTLFFDDLKHFIKSGAFLALASALALTCIVCAVSLPSSFFKSGSPPPITIALINPDDSDYAQALYAMLCDLPEVSDIIWCEKDEAEKLLLQGEVSVVAELPPDIVGSLIHNRPAEIKISARDAMSGASAYTMTVGAARAMNTMQSAVNEYRRAAAIYYDKPADFQKAYSDYSILLLSDALMHRRFVETVSDAADPYSVQLISLIIFIICSGGSMCAFTMLAGQFESGRTRRLSLRGLGVSHIFAAKLIQCLLINISLCVLLGLAAKLIAGSSAAGIGGTAANPSGLVASFSENPGIMGIAASTAIITIAVSPVFMLISFTARSARHTLLASAAAILFFLFTGGGFYPTYLMNMGFLYMNPAYLNVKLTEWLLGGEFPDISIFSCLALSALCLFVVVFKRRAVKC